MLAQLEEAYKRFYSIGSTRGNTCHLLIVLTIPYAEAFFPAGMVTSGRSQHNEYQGSPLQPCTSGVRK